MTFSRGFLTRASSMCRETKYTIAIITSELLDIKYHNLCFVNRFLQDARFSGSSRSILLPVAESRCKQRLPGLGPPPIRVREIPLQTSLRHLS